MCALKADITASALRWRKTALMKGIFMNEAYTLKDLFELFLSKIWFIIILMVLGAAAAYSISEFVLPLKYQSYTTMYVKNNTSKENIGANMNDINASKSLVTTYIAILQDDVVMEAVAEKLVEDYGADAVSKAFAVTDGKVSPSAIGNSVTMDSVNETEVMKIVAVTKNAEMSAAVCNTIAEIAPPFLIRVVGAGSVETIGAAKVNSAPVSPSITKNTAIGAIAGIFVAVLLVFLIDTLDNTIKDANAIGKEFDKAIIGQVYSYSNGKRKSKSGSDNERFTLLDKDVPFNIIEAYKAMRTNIVFSLSTSGKKVFAISSVNPADGKSTIAANNAIALSQAGHKILLIDGDMRKPVIHKMFKLKNNVGLSSAVSKIKKLDDCIQKKVTDNLDVMTSGPKPPNPSELLASEQMEKILSELTDKYDYIIIDTPPLNVVSDAMGLSKYVAGVILVLRYGSTTFDDLGNAMYKTELADMNILGFVFNCVQTKRRAGYYNYRYRYKSAYAYSYAGYGNETEKQTDAKKGE